MLLFIYTLISLILLLLISYKKIHFPFVYIVFFAFILRISVTLVFLTSKSDDLSTFLRDGQFFLDRSTRYEASYFPFISYLGAAALLLKNYINPYIFLKIIFSIFDVLLMIPLYFLSKKNLQSVLLYALNPITIIITNIHGQMDAIPMFFFLSSLVLSAENKLTASVLTLSLSILSKPWPILFVIPLIKKVQKKFIFGLIVFFPLLITFVHSLFFPVPFLDILKKVGTYRGIFGAWGLSKIALYISAYRFNPLSETLMRNFFLLVFISFSYSTANKNIAKSILLSMLFLFVFSPTFGIQWFFWIVPFTLIVKPKFWRVLLVCGSVYLAFGFVWDADYYFRTIMPQWNAVITRVGFIYWLMLIFIFLKNLSLTREK